MNNIFSRFVAVALLLFSGWLTVAKASRPNIILILTDDLGWGDLSCYGQTKYKTPNIDRLAAEGAKLTDFYSTAPYCAPSRAALLTGRYQFRSGMTRNPSPDAGINDVGLPSSELTLGEALGKTGYRTACVGKWHLGHKPEFNPLRHGFDEYLGILYSHDMRPVELVDGTNVVEYPVVLPNLTKKYTARALRFIEENQEKPFFLYFPHALPHKPLAASEELYKASGAGLYGDSMLEVDRSVGAVLEKLDALKLTEKTIVIFTSDNGPWFGGSSGDLRGMKGTTWEGGIRVPLLARWPGKIPAAQINSAPAAMIDLFPTLLKAAGVKVPSDRTIDGKDIMPLLTSSKADSPHEAIFSFGGNELRTVRSGRWKLHVAPPGKSKALAPNEKWEDKRAPDGVTIIAQFEQAHPSEHPGVTTGDEGVPGALFDLQTDPSEQKNIAAANPDIVSQLMHLAGPIMKELGPQSGRPGNKSRKH